MAKIPAPNAVNVRAAVKRTQEETKASAEIGRVRHTKEHITEYDNESITLTNGDHIKHKEIYFTFVNEVL